MRGRIAVLAALCAGLGAAQEPAPVPRAVPGFEVDEPPAHVARLIARARGTGFEADVAARELGTTPEAEPFVRHALLRAPHRRLRAAHDAQLDARDARNVRRAKAWADAGRADLLVEAAVMARTDEAGDALMEQLAVLAHATKRRAWNARTGQKVPVANDDPRPTRFGYHSGYREFLADKRLVRFTGQRVVVEQPDRFVLVRAHEYVAPSNCHTTIAAVRDRFDTDRRSTLISDACIFSNGDVALGSFDQGFVCADGDVVHWSREPKGSYADVLGATVVVRGSVLVNPALSGGSSAVYVGGDVRLTARQAIPTIGVFAGGTAHIDGQATRKPEVVKSNVKENPFGVRFFETDELGVKVEDADGGARLVRVDATSPLAAHGLKSGDVVVRIDSARVPNAKEFRRELRRAAVGGSGVFWVRGDGARQTRVVGFGDVFGR